MTRGDWIGLAGIVVAIAAFLYSMITNKQKRELTTLNEKLQLQVRSLSMDDIRAFANELIRFLGDWRPEVIYCPDLRAAFVAHIVISEMRSNPPILTGYVFPRDRPAVLTAPDGYYSEISAGRYTVLIEEYVYKYEGKKILVLDEIAVTGESVHYIRKALLEHGFKKEQIRTSAVVVCDSAVQSGRNPDFSWRQRQTNDIVFPWGRWE